MLVCIIDRQKISITENDLAFLIVTSIDQRIRHRKEEKKGEGEIGKMGRRHPTKFRISMDEEEGGLRY